MRKLELEEYIETQIIPRYHSFDKAHRVDHARMVIERSNVLAQQCGADVCMSYVVAAYHDTGLAVERDRHHIISGEILISDPELPRWFSRQQLETMREAVEDHRASTDHEPRSIYGRIVAEADRLIDPLTILRRTVQYGLANYPTLNREHHFERLKQHMAEKYAEGGYLRLWIDGSENAQQLESLRTTIRNEMELRSLFDQIYDQERSDTSENVTQK